MLGRKLDRFCLVQERIETLGGTAGDGRFERCGWIDAWNARRVGLLFGSLSCSSLISLTILADICKMICVALTEPVLPASHPMSRVIEQGTFAANAQSTPASTMGDPKAQQCTTFRRRKLQQRESTRLKERIGKLRLGKSGKQRYVPDTLTRNVGAPSANHSASFRSFSHSMNIW